MSVEPCENFGINTDYRWRSVVAQITSGFGRFIQRLGVELETRKQQRIDRDAFNSILTLDERSLADIGVTREEVLWASKLPLSENAALELKVLKSGNQK
ncbi:MAG: hypothetical protein AAGF25_10190 [Pseudomonadota bacterium]